MVHLPKDVPVFLDFLPTNLRDCYALIKMYGQWFITAEDQGNQELANGFGNVLDHLRYRYIKFQKLSDPESRYIVQTYEQLMPAEFHFSPVEQNDVEPKVCSINKIVESKEPDSVKVDPVVVDPPTPPSSPTPIELATIKEEKMRLITSAVTGEAVNTDNIQAIIDAESLNVINDAPEPDTQVSDETSPDDTVLDKEEVIHDLADQQDAILIQPKKLGTLKELQKGLDPTITIGTRRSPYKPHVRQMIKNVRRGGIILKEEEGNVAARQLLRAQFGCAVVYQKDYICMSRPRKIEGQIISPRMREFILAVQSETKAYDYQ